MCSMPYIRIMTWGTKEMLFLTLFIEFKLYFQSPYMMRMGDIFFNTFNTKNKVLKVFKLKFWKYH